ncbi:amiloride-sensitive sodium channel subunit alpha-like [Eublepharis macularius]|uniref:Epithelial sodium channel subunit alpha n=1 Tax=Eublepharis macularius TaxID=481883 RepID=A0AA97KEE4_EUBMA|nr:amiloride-sensitive sodium channel subunit alpha-like [Eublepharis macularius]
MPDQMENDDLNQEVSTKVQPPEDFLEFPASYQELFEFFCSHSTVHGVIRLVHPAGNKMKTTFWTVLFLLTVALLYWQFGETFEHYYSYPVNLKISLHSDRLMFPAVTLCTLRPQRYSAIREELDELDRLTHQVLVDLYGFKKPQEPNLPDSRSPHLLHLVRDIQRHPLQHLEPEDPTGLGRSGHEGRVGFILCNRTNGDCFYQTFSSGIDAVQEWYSFHYINLLARLPREQILNEDDAANFIFSCRFNKEPCDKDNFTHFHHPSYGNCYTLNDKTGWTSSVPGIQHGLSLLLHIKQNNLIPLLSTRVGARVMVHDQNEPAFMGEGGFDVRPNMQTSITMEKKVLEHLGGNYGSCTWNGSDVPVRNLYPFKYTKQGCVHSCFQTTMVERCGCAHYFYPLPSGAEYCDYAKHVAWGHCYYRLQAEFKSNKLECFNKCPKPCRVTQYLLSAAYSQWMSTLSKEWVSYVLAQTKEYNATQRNSISKVHIFFDEWRYKSTQESPAFTINMLLSQLGAHWGLWFGSSIISLMEVLELMVDMVVVTCIVSFGFLRWISTPNVSGAGTSSSTTPGDATIQPEPYDGGKADCTTEASSQDNPDVAAVSELKNDVEAAFQLELCSHDGVTIPSGSSDPRSCSCDSYQPQPGSYGHAVSQPRNTPVFHSSLPIQSIVKELMDIGPTGRDRDLELGL